MNSLKILKANQQLIIFPILSGISLLLVIGSFFTVTLANAGWDPENIGEVSSAVIMLCYFYFIS